ncbi:MAG: ECF-type sigma factor [Acidobacteriota bacterium]
MDDRSEDIQPTVAEPRSAGEPPSTAAASGSPGPRLLAEVYDELRRLARARMARERPGQTLEPTALVHEAWLRLGGDKSRHWDHRGHFFAAAAEAMRRILIERARRIGRHRHGGGQRRTSLGATLADGWSPDASTRLDVAELLALDGALDRLAQRDEAMANVVRLRFWAGLTVDEAAEALDLSARSVSRKWTAARAWLLRELRDWRPPGE